MDEAYAVYHRVKNAGALPASAHANLSMWVPSLSRVCPATVSGDSAAFRKNWLFHLSSIARGRAPYRVYFLSDGGVAIAECVVSGPSFRFPFMRAGDLQIGLVYTDERHRHQGVARRMVAAVIGRHPGAAFWWVTAATNHASRTVAVASGFELIGTASRVSRLGIARFLMDAK